MPVAPELSQPGALSSAEIIEISLAAIGILISAVGILIAAIGTAIQVFQFFHQVNK